ncbi:helix-turn-helix transcriptional regulator [Rhodoblastus sp.]|uniref:helix-turn-helix transcriptional regulator n=1 Tax=Rhodoblastus sp. TaxID=1962975 RepID=UPI0035AE7C81
MIGTDDFIAIEDAFLAASLGQGEWGAAMEQAASATASRGAILFSLKSHELCPSMTESMIEASEFYLTQGWNACDLRFRGVETLMRRGVVTDLDIATRAEIEDHPYYRDFLGRFDLRWFAGLRVQATGDTFVLSIQRGPAQDPFSRRDTLRLAELGRRLSTVARVADRVREAWLAGIFDLLEALRTPAALLAVDGRVLRFNATMEQLFSPALLIRNGRLHLMDRDAARALDHVLASPSLGNGEPIVVRRPDLLPIVLRPLRAPASLSNCGGEPQIALMASDLGARRGADPDLLTRIFGLSAAEARLTAALAAGETLESVAMGAGVSVETARGHLKRVFGKTGVNRQGALIALALKASKC